MNNLSVYVTIIFVLQLLFYKIKFIMSIPKFIKNKHFIIVFVKSPGHNSISWAFII